jgi:FMN phosphatase YigB (HAD superfamily)
MSLHFISTIYTYTKTPDKPHLTPAQVITKTFTPFLPASEPLPDALISDLLARFSTDAGYALYPDVLPFFAHLRSLRTLPSSQLPPQNGPWNWSRTVVGIISNSDDRIPGILTALGLKVGPRRVGEGGSIQRFAFEKKRAGKEEDVSFAVLSYDVGYEKPDRRIFDAAKDLLNESLAEESEVGGDAEDANDFHMLYVGDDVRKDYFGAGNAGWAAVVLDREGRWDEELKGRAVAMVETKIEGDGEGEALRKVAVINDLRSLYGRVEERV